MNPNQPRKGFESFRFRAAVLDADPWGSESWGMGMDSCRSDFSIGSVDEFHATDRSAPSERGSGFNSLPSVNELRPTNSAVTAPPSSTIRASALRLLQRAASTPVVTNDLSFSIENDEEKKTVDNDGLCSSGCSASAVRQEKSKELSIQPSPSPPDSPTSVINQRNAGPYTIIAFVNTASGGQMGKELEESLQSHLGPSHVIDLKSCSPGNMPEDTLIKCAHDPMVRVLACGGDGTCGWIFSSLDKVWSTVLGQTTSNCRVHLSKYKDHLPLAIMPLGTGNDLSRQYGWGPSFQSHMKDKSMITAVQRAKLTGLDRWRCIIMPLNSLDEEEKKLIPNILGEMSETNAMESTMNVFHLLLKEDDSKKSTQSQRKSQKTLTTTPEPSTQIFDGVFCNYFSLGMDAKIVYLFHREREMHPEKFSSPLKNKMVYIQKSPAALKTPKLRKWVKVLVNDENGNLVNLKIPGDCRAIILMNIQSYAGGRHLTSKSKGDSTDGAVEVIFVSNAIRAAACAAMGRVMPFLLFHVAAQTNHVCIRTRCPLHCQVDGEPWLQEEGVVQVKFHSRNPILEKIKDQTSCGCMGSADETVIN